MNHRDIRESATQAAERLFDRRERLEEHEHESVMLLWLSDGEIQNIIGCFEAHEVGHGLTLEERVLGALVAERDESTPEGIAHGLSDRIEVEPERPVNARSVADFLGLQKTDWVYQHAQELGGFRLGRGTKPRWRFLLSEIPGRLRTLQRSQPVRPPDPPRTREPRRRPTEKGTTPNGAPLLDFEAA
jgi:hypothetical protein